MDSQADLRLSIVDQSPVAEGSTGAQALANTIDLARHADRLGYHRYWVAEHHGGPMLAGPSPEALVGPIASATSRIRVGSGGVMLPHYSAFKVAETFSLLAGLFPGRIDLGIGRAAGTDPVTTLALQRERDHAVADDFADQLAELLAYLDGRIPPEHPFARLLETLPGRPQLPAPWLLGSSPQSAVWAAELGLPYAFADFINSQGAEIAAAYRERFQPQPARATALTEPCTAVAAWVVCADTDEEAERVAASGRMAFTMLRRGTLGPVPSPDRAERFLAEEAARRGREDEGAVARAPRRRTIVGSPEKVRAGVLALASEYGAQEVIAVNVTWSHEARVRSYELLAQALLGSAARLDLDDQLARAGADDVAAV